MEDTAKIYPDAANEIGKLFGLQGGSANDGAQDSHGSAGSTAQANVHGPSPANLPVFDPASDDVIEVTPTSHEAEATATATTHTATNEPVDIVVPPPPAREHQQPTLEELTGDPNDKPNNRLLKTLKKVAPYLVVFTIGLLLYSYFFSSFSFSSLFKGSGSTEVASQTEQANQMQALENQQAGAYQQWIAQFFYDVSDPSIVDMNTDVSGNGLTNFEKYTLNLNPKAYDTLGLGMSDGQAILQGINPWTGQELTDNQRQIVDTYFDKQSISDRIAAGALKQSQQLAFNASNATAVSGNSGYDSTTNYSFVDGHNATSGIANYGGVGNGNASAVPGNARVAGASTFGNQSTGSTTSPVSLNNLDINTNVPGHLDIPANKISTPLIFSKSTNDFNNDLHKGVVHYPGTPMPGDIGTSYISGHSSGYFWDKNAYKNVFRGLGNVKDGTSFTITVTLNNGKKAVLHYVVQSRQEFAPNDQAQFTQTSDSRVALSTCWPIDTTAKRLVLFARLTQTEQ